MNEFIKTIGQPLKPSDYGKQNIISKLSSITKTQNLINDHEQLKHEYEMLHQNYGVLKNQNDMLIKENQNLEANSKGYSEEVNELRNKIKGLSINTGSTNEKVGMENIKQIETDLETTKKKLDEQLSKYQNLLKEYDVKINESTQFQQLKKLLQDKNALIIDLKNKVANYEEKEEEK